MEECQNCSRERIRYDSHRDEYYCYDCGVVQEPPINKNDLDGVKIHPNRVPLWTTLGTTQCDNQIKRIDDRMGMYKLTELDKRFIRFIGTEEIVDLKKLWKQFKDEFSDKNEFYVTLRRLRDQGKIKKGYVVND